MNPKNNLKIHPSVVHAHSIKTICKPLEKLGIYYFAHVNISQNKFSAINNNPSFIEHYIKNQYYNSDIHMKNDNKFGNYIIWDAVDLCGKSDKMHQEAGKFGIKHTFTIIEKNSSSNDFYHFATHSASCSINQVYLSQLDLLKLFILHYKENIKRSKELASAFEMTFDLDVLFGNYETETNSFSHLSDMRFQFIQSLKFNLTPREIDCFMLTLKGKTAKQIAILLGLSYRTVEEYICNIKTKLQVISKSALVEKLGFMFSDHD
jgi:DNA-binding CsgD family transcriptional regulator